MKIDREKIRWGVKEIDRKINLKENLNVSFFSSYRKSLSIAVSIQDRALEAQACYSLGNTYTLLRNYALAVEFHMRHLRIAQELSDRVGESRAYWSLGNAYSALGKHDSALDYARKHLHISKEVRHFFIFFFFCDFAVKEKQFNTPLS